MSIFIGRFKGYRYDFKAEERFRGGRAGWVVGILFLFLFVAGITFLLFGIVEFGLYSVCISVSVLIIAAVLFNKKSICSGCGKHMLRTSLSVGSERCSLLEETLEGGLNLGDECYVFDDGVVNRIRMEVYHCRKCKLLFISHKRMPHKVEGNWEGVVRQKRFKDKIGKLKREGKLKSRE